MGGGEGIFGLCFHIMAYHRRKSGQELKQARNLEAEADTEAMEGCCLLACSALLSYRTLNHKHRGGTTTMGWALPHKSLIKKILSRFAYNQMLWRYFLS